ncbi:MAG: hypothetical protein GY936_17420 [Ignavibacteriae bacterium]|nr:hypothetical protein [Ignavibacteriota bacterium]
MKKIIIAFSLILSCLILIACSESKENIFNNEVKLVNNENEQKVDVVIDGKLFTSYLYTNKISNLRKTTLFPIVAANGVTVTRGFPLEPRANERTDHPHHIGAWLNYGDVNGLDYWGNSDAIPMERNNEMGVIRHGKILETKNGHGKGELITTANWLKPNGEVLLREKTDFIFHSKEGIRMIDRITILTAQEEVVFFKDTKEGMLAIRVARQLEHPSDKPVTLSDAHGGKTDVPVLDNTGVTGHYLSSEGIEGMDVWGKRAKWVSLDGTIENKDVSVVIFDNPQNVGFPTYWHARGYGLFAANPFGQNTFSKGKETLNFSLESGESVTLKYRFLILDGKAKTKEIESEYQKYIQNN